MLLHPWAIVVGVLAAGLPVAVHFLTRPRPARRPLSTFRFVREAIRQRRARHRLRDFLVLSLRTLAVLLLAAAVARPLIGRNTTAVVEDDVDTIRVVILDASQSMGARSRGVQALERARPIASDLLEYRRGLKANLIVAAARPRALFDRPSTNFAALREELADAQVLPEQIDVEAALNAAANVLGNSGAVAVRPELVIISDFQRSNWASADFSQFPADTVIRLEAVAPEEAPANLAILRAGGRGRAEVGREARLEVEVGNFSSTPQQVRIEVALGETAHQLSGTCPPRTTTTLTGELLPRDAGWQVGQARLVGLEDALPDDNVRPLVLQVRPAPVYGLMTRQPESQRPSSSYFLERALVPAADETRRSTARVVRLDPDDPDPELLAVAELLIVDHPGRLSDEAVGQLASLLRRGRGLLYVASEPADALSLQRLVRAAGSGLQLPVEFAPPSVHQERRGLFLIEVRRELPPFRIFGDELTAALSPLRFSGGLVSRPVEGALQEDVLATFNDRSAFLVSAGSGAGTLIVMNADLGISNLPKSPLFVPLVGEIAQRLLGGAAEAREFSTGEPLAVALPAEAGAADGLTIVDPSGRPVKMGELATESTGVLWSAEAAGPPGVYQVQRDGTTQFAIATTIPPSESDLRSLSADVFERRLAGGRDVRFRAQATGSQDQQDTLWTWLAVACAACLLGEVVTLRAFRT